MKIGIAVQHMTDIRGAQRGGCSDCPVARAINRRFGLRLNSTSRPGVCVAGGSAPQFAKVSFFNFGDETLSVELPPSAATWIKQYDEGEFMEPITFVIDVPDALGLLAQPVPALPACVGF